MDTTKNTNFEEIVNSATPALVDFYAEWCGPCKTIAPMIDSLKEEYKGRANVVKIDVDANPELANKYDIRSIPTLMIFKEGKILGTVKGSVPKNQISSMIEKSL